MVRTKETLTSLIRGFLILGTAYLFTAMGIHFCVEKVQGRSPGFTDEVDAKLKWFIDHKEDYDAIFLGSSHVYYQIDPQVFDRELASIHPNFRSFNFGARGMPWIEAKYLIERIGQVKSRRLKYLVIGAPSRLDFVRVSILSTRSLHIHDFKHTLELLRRHLTSRLPLSLKLKVVSLSLAGFLARTSNAGAVNLLQRCWLDADPSEQRVAESGGFQAFDDLPEDDKRVTRRGQFQTPPGRKEDDIEPRDLIELANGAKAFGLRPVFLFPPSPKKRMYKLATLDWESRGGFASLSFADPKQHPALFDHALRWDYEHLNARGASLYSRLIAERFAEAVLASPKRASRGALKKREERS